MGETVEIFLGFDPGGIGSFGWSICREESGDLKRIDSGVVDNALEAVQAVERRLQGKRVLAAGIDAPMFWSETGFRQVDDIIRSELTPYVGSLASGIVQAPNSMKGACLVQGILVGASLYQKFKAPITEAHPGALRCLLQSRSVDKALPPGLRQLEAELKRSKEDKENHEWDALAAAYAAWCMHRQAPGWSDLFPRETNRVLPLGTPVSYWMPIQPPA